MASTMRGLLAHPLTFLFAFLAAPVVWLGGLFIFDVTRIAAGLMLVALAANPRLRSTGPLELPRSHRLAIAGVAVAYLALLLAHQLAKVKLGRQGIDFAIFTQIVDSIARRGAPLSSLIGPEWRNFLSHHFVPVLYLPAALTAAGLSAPTATLLVHVANVAVGFLALHGIFRQVGLSPSVSIALVLVAMLNPALRPEIFWGIHDETFALGFVGLAFLFWLRGRFLASALMLALSATTKESFFLFMVSFSGVAIVAHHRFHPAETASAARRVFGVTALLGLAGFAGYFFLQPLLIGKQFDHLNKLATLDTLLSPSVLGQKLLFTGMVLLPSLGLGLFTWRGRAILATPLPFIGIVWASGYEEMYRPLGYYGVVTSFIAFIAAAVSMVDLAPRWRGLLQSAPALLFLGWLGLCLGTHLPARDVYRAIGDTSLDAAHLDWIPDEARVIADPAAVLALLRTAHPVRLYSAGIQPEPPAFDYLVFNPKGWEPLPPSLEQLTEPCHPSGGWVVRCPRQRQ
ncbi:DUF2079 domain-containing protein [Archangium violaceum]|uniref:DUF2079 domain-containing protein n=1 Tax=Archangium violaceum TaxID=83451 RepID=UPI002B2CE177|nr:DUF2079 domain-containing protein [Archangium violaceum]